MNCVIAVVGAHTAVGRNVVSALSDIGMSSEDVVALSYEDTVGKRLSYGENESLVCRSVDKYDFEGASLAIFSSGDGVAERYIGDAIVGGCVVIDGTAHSRQDVSIPLVVPSINSICIGEYKKLGVIATPCSAASQVSTVLFPLHECVKIERVVVTTFHSVSHVGREAMSELYNQTKSMFMSQKVQCSELPKQISFNCIPFVGEMADGEYTSEEKCISHEINRLLCGEVEVAVTCVFVPVYVSHSAVLNIQFCNAISRDEVLEVLSDSPNILVVDGESETKYITPIECVNDEEVYVSRVRCDSTVPHGISMWCTADNLKRSATDMVKIAQILAAEHLA
ncbi:aspartate-semialdehyde dehydrogenase [Candidatus Anaplasma sp. TIGMIC]|uniref:aspartate-semialdehyde dehydrogenase n=1 Tax=Candidatus Anaplasma sp. TIGMIC TaxID=3020713 RepID=UPI002330961C|nr:aspartate-semialdehyde dehydrogenase [Candidatus Anaplasma sp. TIGMIC]MDB1135655.1 aspartate-semialdehyde dehydrogenase [Candidatus Anaplasma sp. TIGMIC]